MCLKCIRLVQTFNLNETKQRTRCLSVSVCVRVSDNQIGQQQERFKHTDKARERWEIFCCLWLYEAPDSWNSARLSFMFLWTYTAQTCASIHSFFSLLKRKLNLAAKFLPLLSYWFVPPYDACRVIGFFIYKSIFPFWKFSRSAP